MMINKMNNKEMIMFFLMKKCNRNNLKTIKLQINKILMNNYKKFKMKNILINNKL